MCFASWGTCVWHRSKYIIHNVLFSLIVILFFFSSFIPLIVLFYLFFPCRGGSELLLRVLYYTFHFFYSFFRRHIFIIYKIEGLESELIDQFIAYGREQWKLYSYTSLISCANTYSCRAEKIDNFSVLRNNSDFLHSFLAQHCHRRLG